MTLSPSDVAILPDDIRRLSRLLHINLFTFKLQFVGEDRLFVGILVVEGAEEVFRGRQDVEFLLFERVHFFFHLVGFVKFSSHQKVGPLLEQAHQLVVVEGQLQIGDSVDGRDLFSFFDDFEVFLPLFHVISAHVVFADPLFDLVD